MLDFNKTIRSERVFLRPMQVTDFAPMQALTADTNMWYYFTADLSNQATLKAWIDSAVSDLNQRLALPLTILEPNETQIIGTTRIGNLSAVDKRVEIGWTWIGKDYHGTGINGHVKQLLFDYLFTQTDTVRIEFKTDVLNIPARKGMEKVGLIEEGVLKSHTLMTNNRRRDTVYYRLLRDEWLHSTSLSE